RATASSRKRQPGGRVYFVGRRSRATSQCLVGTSKQRQVVSTTIPVAQRFAHVTRLAASGKLLTLAGELPGEHAAKGARVGTRVSADEGNNRAQVQLTV